jgi:hypothetical protein
VHAAQPRADAHAEHGAAQPRAGEHAAHAGAQPQPSAHARHGAGAAPPSAEAPAVASAADRKLLELASELVRDSVVRRRIQQDSALRRAWADPGVRRAVNGQP